jgi:hypothetical protein
MTNHLSGENDGGRSAGTAPECPLRAASAANQAVLYGALVGDAVEPPGSRHAFEFVLTLIAQFDVGPSDQVGDCA